MPNVTSCAKPGCIGNKLTNVGASSEVILITI